MNARPVYLNTGDEPVAAFFHPAPGDVAVLLCPPLGWDDICSYRSRRDWAEQLAAAAHPVLRFELPGTGDSAGSPRDPGRLDVWTAATAGAASWLRAETGARRTVAIGIGVGGVAAWCAAAAGAPVDDLVLWAVPSQGRALVRELRAFVQLEDSSGHPPDADLEALPEGSIVPGGFLLTAETVADLESLDLTALPLPRTGDRRVLALGRDGMAVDDRLIEHLRQNGADVVVADGDGYGTMMQDPASARSPVRVFERVEAWLAEDAGTATDAHLESVPETRAALELVESGVRVRELPLTIDQPFGRMYGVLAEPASAERAELCAVLLNASAVRRVGPNRLWVEIARRWAAQGVPTVRLDLEGVGDADGESDRYSDIAELYAPEFVGQVHVALDALEARGLPGRFLLLGLCSGAYWSFHGALRDDRVVAAVMLNPRVLFWDRLLHPGRVARHLRQQLFRPSAWLRIFRGELPRLVARLRELARWLPARVWEALPKPSGATRDDPVERAFDRLRDEGKYAFFVFCEDEPLREELEREGHVARSDRWPNVEFAWIPGVNHTLRPPWMQARAHELVDQALATALERSGAARTPVS